MNVIYNYTMVILQIVKRGSAENKIENDIDTNTNLMKSMYSQKTKQTTIQANSTFLSKKPAKI